MTPVDTRVEHRQTVQRVALQPLVNHQPTRKGLNGSQIVVAGLYAQTVFPQVGQEALHVGGLDLAGTLPIARIDKSSNLAHYFDNVSRRVVLTLLALLEVVQVDIYWFDHLIFNRIFKPRLLTFDFLHQSFKLRLRHHLVGRQRNPLLAAERIRVSQVTAGVAHAWSSTTAAFGRPTSLRISTTCSRPWYCTSWPTSCSNCPFSRRI